MRSMWAARRRNRPMSSTYPGGLSPVMWKKQEKPLPLWRRKKGLVIKTMIGGGFGSKLDTYAFEYIAILLAHRTRKPVKIVFSREEEFFATSPRQPAVIDISQGCTKDGRLTF